MNLNAYHIQFLQLLMAAAARFIIIGGQARTLHRSYVTKDLDIWLDMSFASQAKALSALTVWLSKYGSHSHLSASSLPNALPPQTQIHLPEWDTYFLDESGALVEIKTDDGIDLLTSLHDWDFDEVFERSIRHIEHGMFLQVLSESDFRLADALRPS